MISHKHLFILLSVICSGSCESWPNLLKWTRPARQPVKQTILVEQFEKAYESEDLQKIDSLLDQDPQLAIAIQKDGNTFLHWAALSGFLPSVKKVVEKLSTHQLFPQNDDYQTPLDWAHFGYRETYESDTIESLSIHFRCLAIMRILKKAQTLEANMQKTKSARSAIK